MNLIYHMSLSETYTILLIASYEKTTTWAPNIVFISKTI